MKKSISIIGIIICVSLFLGCQTDIDGGSSSKTSNQTGETNAVRALLDETTVVLEDGVTYGDLGVTVETRTEMLIDRLNAKTGKYVYPDEDMITADDFMQLIESKKNELNIPNLEEPGEEDLRMIQQKFPNLTYEQIAENLDAITEVYQDELSALIFDSVIAKSIAKGTDIPYPTTDGSARGLWSTGKRIWNKLTGKTKKAKEKVVETVKSIKIVDKWRALKFMGETVTVYEVGAALKRPFSALTLKKAINKSYDLTEEYMNAKPKSMNDKIDAFRHGIFAIALAKESCGTKRTKLRWARDFLDAHEKGAKYVEYDAEMDWHNNEVGLRYYDRNTKRRYKDLVIVKFERSPDEPSYSECCNYLKQNTEKAVFVDDRNPFSKFKEELKKVSRDTLVWIKFNEKDNGIGE